MPHADDAIYYRNRADQSRLLAERARSDEARLAHERLAGMYDQMAQHCSRAVLQIVPSMRQ